MVDVIKTLGFEYVAANPGSSFEGLHESVINYGSNKMPELLTCCHEESSVAMAHGFAKIEGKPMLAFLHGTIGLQHASMAIYNAYADRVPVYMIVGNWMDGAARGPTASTRTTAPRTWRRWSATTSSGTMNPLRWATSPSPPFEPTNSR